MTAPDTGASVRLDLWLWAARFFKNRTLSRQAIETGKVELDGQRPKVSRAVRAGDILRITRGEDTFEITVLAVAGKRGSATVAQSLYRESEVSRAAREKARELRAAAHAGYEAPRTKPDKRARRLIRALGDIDAG